MAFSPITHLRHFDIAVPDYQKQVEFYKNHWGLTEMENDGGVTYFAAEGSPEQYSVRVRQAEEKRLDMVAFGAADKASVDQLASDLIAKGVKLIGEPDDVRTLGGGYGFRFFDLEGRTIEVSSDVEVRKHRKIEEREAIPVRLSHVVLNSPEPEKMRAWYEQHLGFRLSDTLNHPHMGDLFYFMRCNAQHHSIAISRGPHASLQHASFELRGIDEYMRGSGKLLRSGFKKIWGPGRHKAGDNTFTYFHDPNGNTMEYTTELDSVDEDTWHPSIFDTREPETSDQWGTGGDMDEFIAREMFNDPDKGLFVPPPV
ncbi:VOC family protein [Arthrobacter sp. EH-1B-1]|uniref:VOC family protein n=1 Tax=Arthrobacter vasquezii TaxID=2977629 RepID=A0ABT6CWH2_9MICC|nr:VOC family protein [Arthrobacter vasquezii]MDF9277920.1 VOC family protein [Arthrobacter vasquezii]